MLAVQTSSSLVESVTSVVSYRMELHTRRWVDFWIVAGRQAKKVAVQSSQRTASTRDADIKGRRRLYDGKLEDVYDYRLGVQEQEEAWAWPKDVVCREQIDDEKSENQANNYRDDLVDNFSTHQDEVEKLLSKGVKKLGLNGR
jgi:hypothetical protein